MSVAKDNDNLRPGCIGSVSSRNAPEYLTFEACTQSSFWIQSATTITAGRKPDLAAIFATPIYLAYRSEDVQPSPTSTLIVAAPGIATGAMAGIVVSSVIGALLLGVGITFIAMKLWKRRHAHETSGAAVPQAEARDPWQDQHQQLHHNQYSTSNDPDHFQNIYSGLKPELSATPGAPRVELPSVRDNKAEPGSSCHQALPPTATTPIVGVQGNNQGHGPHHLLETGDLEHHNGVTSTTEPSALHEMEGSGAAGELASEEGHWQNCSAPVSPLGSPTLESQEAGNHGMGQPVTVVSPLSPPGDLTSSVRDAGQQAE